MNEIVFLVCQKQRTALKYMLIKHQNSQKQNGSKCTNDNSWQVCFYRGTEAGGGGGVNGGHSLSPPSHFILATGLKLKVSDQEGQVNLTIT